ncbi:MAG: AtpZ/AtpI family protein [Acidimicrobiia bacterium]|nr:AtpZ/AtpI family protein [Acidimicrobiia bacterium]
MEKDRTGNGRSGLVPDRSAVTGGFSPGVDLASSVIAGLLIGLALDWALGTSPVLVIVFTIAGFVGGFYKLWRHSAILEELAKERDRGA